MTYLGPQKFRGVLPHSAVVAKVASQELFPGLVSKDIFQSYSLLLTLTLPMLAMYLTTAA